MQKEIVNFCLKKGFLIDDEAIGLFSETNDLESVKIIIEKIKEKTHKRIITKNTLEQNKDELKKYISDLSEESQKSLEKIKIKLGLSIEISKEIINPLNETTREINISSKDSFQKKSSQNINISTTTLVQDKKLEVGDFVNYFRNRFNEFKNLFTEHSELKNLISLNKIGSARNNFSVIGLVVRKNTTKNNNLLLDIEDLTGTARIIVSSNKKELIEKAEDIALDSVIAFNVSGNKEILFANDIIFPDCILAERKKSSVDENVLFISDIHIGSSKFKEDNFLKFIDYLNSDSIEEVKKIKYLFIVGDLVAGIGNYPRQEEELKINDLEEQFIYSANLLKKIRKNIKIIISPGNHDGIRLMEPQPIFDKKYAWPLYEMENVLLVPNPCDLNIGSYNGFEGFNILVYHGFSFPYYADNLSSLIIQKAIHKPELIAKYLLKNRHLAPTHGSMQYFPGDKDNHFIKNIPDILVTGHLHKSSISYYNNILYISCSTWEEMTDYMEKVGAKPDFCKVPMFNLKTRAIKILDFE